MLHAAREQVLLAVSKLCLLAGECLRSGADRHVPATSGSWLLLGSRTVTAPLASSTAVMAPQKLRCHHLLLHLAGRTPESAIKALDADYRQYRLLENQLLQKRARLVGKLPEIQKAKNAVEMLTKKAADQDEVRQWGFSMAGRRRGSWHRAGVGPYLIDMLCSKEQQASQ